MNEDIYKHLLGCLVDWYLILLVQGKEDSPSARAIAEVVEAEINFGGNNNKRH